MIITNLKKEDRRVQVNDVSSLEIKTYGKDNLYPQTAKLLTSSSGIAASCLRTYQKFIEGRGFSDKKFYEIVVNGHGLECDELLRLVSNDLADYGGFSLHFNYNALCEISEINHVPFENCRLTIEDDNDYISKIALHPDWGKLKKKTKSKGISKKTIDYIDVYNPKKEIVQAQIEKSGGIEHYNGQVLYFSITGNLVYPLPIYDPECTDISTDVGISNVMYRNTRYNFLTSGMLIRKKRAGNDADDESEDDGFSNSFKQFQGDENACKIIDVVAEFDEEEPKFVPFKTNSFDKEFTVTEKSLSERIGRVFQQPPILRSETVPTGFTQDAINDAYNFYNSITEPERRIIERCFKKIFSNYYDKSINPSNDFSIIPLKYL